MYFLTALEAGSPRSRWFRVSLWWALPPWFCKSPSLYVFLQSLLCTQRQCSGVPLLIRTPVLWDRGRTLLPHLTLVTFMKNLSLKKSTLELEDSIHEFWGEQFRGWWPHTIDYYSAFLKGGILTEAAAWMNLEDNMLNEINQLQKDRYGSTSMQ